MRTVTISMQEYQDLLIDSEKLSRLKAGGVDNWEWYGESLNGFSDDDETMEDWIKNMKEEIKHHP